MHIKKYDFTYSRRLFMDKMAKGTMGAGVLGSLWSAMANAGDASKAYPEELRSLDAYTKGKVKEGDFITKDNAEHVKDLLDPLVYQQITQMGRKIKVVPQTTDPTQLFPYDFLEASLKNQGKAALDADGNVVNKADGKPWLGGTPFADPQSGLEAFANLTISWGRHDTTLYAIRDWDMGPSGAVEYEYELAWCEMNTTARVSDPSGPYLKGQEDKLRYQSVWFTSPNDVKGTAFLNTWHYDQRKFPDLMGYLPAFKRVRRFPTNQRFEPLVPGITFFLSDAWAAGDPMLTWGNYKIVGRQPMLGSQAGDWHGDADNWMIPVHGGPKGMSFFDTSYQLCPEVLIVEAEPTGYPRAPVSKKRVWIDLRNMAFVAYVTYDRRGEIWKSFEVGYSQRVKGATKYLDRNGHLEWAPTYVHSHDIQTNRLTRLLVAERLSNGMKGDYEVPDAYDKYLTVQAMQRLGS